MPEKEGGHRMWQDIVLSLGLSIGEAICINQLNEEEVKNHHKTLTDILAELLSDFADTSLDTGDFHRLVSGKGFVQQIRTYFYTIYGGSGFDKTYRLSLEEYMCQEIPRLNPAEIHDFMEKMCTLYERHLQDTIHRVPAIDALFQLIVKTNRDMLAKLTANQEQILKLLRSFETPAAKIEDEDIQIYHNICEKEYGFIRFTGISGAEKSSPQNINDHYVNNTFSYSDNQEDKYRVPLEKLHPFQLPQLFDCGNKVVILGGAGFGKTTTLNYLYYNYERLFQPCVLKIKIDLKDYAKAIGSEDRDILYCIASDFYKKTKRKKSHDEIERLLSRLLENGHCLIIFDALDEISSQSVRNDVRDAIGNFCDMYYLNRFIITSRETGYLRNRFDNSFLHIRVNEFAPEQIKEYTEKWLKSNYSEMDFSEFWPKFEEEVTRAQCEELIKNPIILVLALVIFETDQTIPNKRVEFYRKCIETFLTKREDLKAFQELSKKTKGILASDMVIPRVAYYKFGRLHQDTDYRFTEKEVKFAILDSLEVSDRIHWLAAIEEYFTYLIERTELIREVNDDIFDFAHKTFSEYFLAVYYAKEYEGEELCDLLEQWIGDSNFDELARLIIEVVIQTDSPRQMDNVINFLFSFLESDNIESEIYFKTNVFSILADLYCHNMLRPKFHNRYFRCILYNPRFVQLVRRCRPRSNGARISIEYDSFILANMYCEAVNKPNEFPKVLHSLFYLNEEFRTNVRNGVKLKSHEHIVNLMIIRKAYFTDVKLTKEFLAQELKYFTENPEGIALVQENPVIFLLTLYLMAARKDYRNMERMASAVLEKNAYFMRYLISDVFMELIKLSMKSCTNLVVFLLAVIDCSHEQVNRLLYVSLPARNSYSWRHPAKEQLNIIWVYNLLNKSESYSDFCETLKEKRLYDNRYDSVLERLYSDYVCYEKHINEEELEPIIKEYESQWQETVTVV